MGFPPPIWNRCASLISAEATPGAELVDTGQNPRQNVRVIKQPVWSRDSAWCQALSALVVQMWLGLSGQKWLAGPVQGFGCVGSWMSHCSTALVSGSGGHSQRSTTLNTGSAGNPVTSSPKPGISFIHSNPEQGHVWGFVSGESTGEGLRC